MRSKSLFLSISLACLFVTASAQAQQGSGFMPAAPEAPPKPHHIVRADVGLQLFNRTFDLKGPTDVLFDAPFYSGLRVGFEFFPVAIFDRTSSGAGLGLQLRTSKHILNTVAAYDFDGEIVDFNVPTRHDMTTISLIYEWQASDAMTLTPSVGMHIVEYSLGYNILFRNTFYRSVDLGLALDYNVGVEGLSLHAGVHIRPGVNLGSTVEPYGSTASSFGFGIEAGLRYISRLGLYGVGQFIYDRYGTTYRPDRNEGRDDSEAVDQYRGLVFSIGYAY